MYHREGRSAWLKTLRVRIGLSYVYNETLVTGSISAISGRVTIVHDINPEGTLPSWSNVLANYDNSGATSQNFRSFASFQNTDRYRILRDEIIEFNPQYYHKAGLSDDKDTLAVERDYFLKFTNKKNQKGKEVRFNPNATGGAISDIDRGAIYVYVRTTADTVRNRIVTGK